VPGPCGIPAEVWKHGGIKLKQELHILLLNVWDKEEVPQDWKDANIISIFKKGCRRFGCSNYRGISLLSIAGKIIAKILLNKLNSLLAPNVLLFESQCGFQSDRSTIDMCSGTPPFCVVLTLFLT